MSRLEFIQLDRPTGAGGPVLVNLNQVKAIEPGNDDTTNGSRIYLGGVEFVVKMPFPKLINVIEKIGASR